MPGISVAPAPRRCCATPKQVGEGETVETSAREFAAYRLLHAASLGARPFHAELRDQAQLSLLDHAFTRHALEVSKNGQTWTSPM